MSEEKVKTTLSEAIQRRIMEIVTKYENMLKEIVIKKGETFDCSPFTSAIQALQTIIDKIE